MTKKSRQDNLIKEAYSQALRRFYETSRDVKKPGYRLQMDRYRKMSRLKASSFFYDALADEALFVAKECSAKPVVGYFCNLVPEEIILACGAFPIRLCSEDINYVQIGEEVIPGDICPVVKSACGSLVDKKVKDADIIVVPAACDGKMKLAEFLSPFKEVYFLDLPRDSDYLKNADIWFEKYSQLYEFLKERYNAGISRRDLLNACEALNERTSVFRKIYRLRAENPGLINSFDYFTMAYASFFSHPLTWIENAKRLYEEALEIKSKTAPAFTGKRFLVAGAPIIFPNFKILEILDETGCEVSADVLCPAYTRLYTPVEIDEETEAGIVRALSLKYIAATTCPCFLGINKLIDGIIDTVKKYTLDGVIYHNLRLCQVYDMETVLLRQVLKENRIPFLSIKTDLGKEDIGQIKTRVEAYIEIM